MYTFVVSSMDAAPEKLIHFCCKRGKMENYIRSLPPFSRISFWKPGCHAVFPSLGQKIPPVQIGRYDRSALGGALGSEYAFPDRTQIFTLTTAFSTLAGSSYRTFTMWASPGNATRNLSVVMWL